MIRCCKNCVPPKRHTCCHDHCKEYIAEKEQNVINKKKAAKEVMYRQYVYDNHIRIEKMLGRF